MGTKHNQFERHERQLESLLPVVNGEPNRIVAFAENLCPISRTLFDRVLRGEPYRTIGADLGISATMVGKKFKELRELLRRRCDSHNVCDYARRFRDWRRAKRELQADFGLLSHFFDDEIGQQPTIDI